VLHVFAFSRCAVLVRHWFEIDLTDASMEHGARIEVRELVAHPHRGSESAAQLLTADRPLWRADLFDRLTDEPDRFAVAHYHPYFSGDEPSGRAWDPALTDDPWQWLRDQISALGATADRKPWPIDPADAQELPHYAGQVVAAAQLFAPELCHSAEQCHQLTRDANGAVRMMIENLERPDLLDTAWVAPWTAAV
jgi:hypothetical protein